MLTFIDEWGRLCSVKNLTPAKSHKYVNELPCSFNAKACIQTPEQVGNEMTEKEFLKYLKEVKRIYS